MKGTKLALVALVASILTTTAFAHDPYMTKSVTKDGECFYVTSNNLVETEPCKITVKTGRYGKNTVLHMGVSNFNIGVANESSRHLDQRYSLNALPANYYLRDVISKKPTTLRILEINHSKPIFCYESLISNVCHN